MKDESQPQAGRSGRFVSGPIEKTTWFDIEVTDEEFEIMLRQKNSGTDQSVVYDKLKKLMEERPELFS
ncbi:MAG: hypothetical protein H7831_05480 [Magnetococcus sp. WYHC-3]